MEKLAQDLKPGDVLTYWDNEMVLSTALGIAQDVTVRCYSYDAQKVLFRHLSYGQEVTVEAPTLTPAQQHAEELLRYAQNLIATGHLDGEETSALRALLAKIDPPKPPTLEEALTVVSSLYHMGREVDPARLEAAGKMLERARQAGCLGKDAP